MFPISHSRHLHHPLTLNLTSIFFSLLYSINSFWLTWLSGAGRPATCVLSAPAVFLTTSHFFLAPGAAYPHWGSVVLRGGGDINFFSAFLDIILKNRKKIAPQSYI